ncbi:MAG: DUF2093 domain-containing protein [Pseudomonadota bacterium]
MLTKRPLPPGHARVRYLDGDIQVIEPGDYVVCAVSGTKVPLQALRYWSVEFQEAYRDAEAASQRLMRAKDSPE